MSASGAEHATELDVDGRIRAREICRVNQPLEIKLSGSLQLSSPSLRNLTKVMEPMRHGWRHPSVTIDLAEVTFVGPAAMAILAAAIGKARSDSARTIQLVRPRDSNVHEYLKRLDFYDVCGAQGVEPYKFKRYDSSGRFCELVEVLSDNQGHQIATSLSEVIKTQMKLGQDASSAIFTTLSEMIDNVFHHAGDESHVTGTSAFVCAQTYGGKQRRVEFAIVDCGVGIRASLSRNPANKGRFTDDTTAIELALQPKVTGNVERNAGLGLSLVAGVTRLNPGGQLWICSKTGMVGVGGRPGNNWTIRHPISTWPGSIVAGRFRLDGVLNTTPVWDSLPRSDDDDQLGDWIKA